MIHVPVEARPASTVIVVRDHSLGPQVLMVRRRTGGFFGGLTAFPGGGLESFDSGPLARSVVSGDADDQPFRAAALRELAEETSLALTTAGVVTAPPERGEHLYRALSGASVLDGENLALVSRWITPEEAPSRYDTRFYLTRIDGDPEIRVDASELAGGEWASPVVALDLQRAGKWQMFTPTIAHLAWLAEFRNVDALMSAAYAGDEYLVKPGGPDDDLDGRMGND